MANEKVYVGETGIKEFYRKIKQLINNFGGYEEATGTGDDNHPAVANPSTKIIYLVPVQDGSTPNLYDEWFWHINETTHVGNWKLFGKTTFTENSWKHWSEQNGSTSADSTGTSVYIGRQNTITAGPYGDNCVIGAENTLKNGFIFGKLNTASDRTALIIGTGNTSTSFDQIILGNNNSDAGYTTALVGYNNTIAASVHDCSIFGSENNLKVKSWSTQASSMHGRGNVAEDFYISDMFGSNNQSYLDKQSGIYAKDSHTERNYFTSVFGQSIKAFDNRLSAIFGYNNTVSKMFESVVIGAAVNASGISSNSEGSSNVIIGASSGGVTVKASNSALVLSYSNVFGSYNAIIGANSDIGDPSIEGSNGQSDNNSGIAGFYSHVRPKSNNNLFVMSYEILRGSRNVDINQYGKTVGDSNINIGGYNSIGDNAYATTPTTRSYNIAIGQSNNIQRDNSILIGKSNSVSFDDNTDYSDSYVTTFGQSNTATNAANAYQFGRNNRVTGNGLPDTENTQSSSLHHSLAVNIGRDNGVVGEGVNVGKFNNSTVGGSTFGQFNYASNGSTAVGEHCSSYIGSATFGKYNLASSGAFAIGTGATAYNGAIAFGGSSLYASGVAFAIGFGNYQSDSSTRSEVTSGSVAFIADTINRWSSGSFTKSRISGGSFGLGMYNTISESSIGIGACNTVSEHSVAIGVYNQCTYDSFAVGSSNNNIGYLDGSTPCGNGYAFGYNNHHVYNLAFAAGIQNSNIVGTASAFGIGNSSVTDNSSAFGHNNRVVDDFSVVVGNWNSNVNDGSQVLGSNNNTINDGSIALGISNSNVINSSTAIGIANYACNGSVAIGVANNSAGGVFSMGIANIAAPDYYDHPTDYDTWKESFHGNAAVIGLGNRIKNIRDSWHSGDMSLNERRNTFSVAVGAYITAYGHNIIALGFGHTIGDPATWFDDTEVETDNDGFMTAIGYRCEAFRNFDTAIGYKSVAKGGENLAIHHSSAVGYRNVAIGDSSVVGITNYGFMESTLTTDKADPLDGQFARNTLLNSKITHKESGYENLEAFVDNMAMHTVAWMEGGSMGIARNILAYNPGIYNSRWDYGQQKYVNELVDQLKLSANNSVAENIVMFSKQSQGNLPKITANQTVTGNVIFRSYANTNNMYYFDENLFAYSVIDLHSTSTYAIQNNLVLASKFEGSNFSANLNNNIVVGNSYLDVNNDTADDSSYNILMNGSGLITRIPNSVYGYRSSKNNVLFGTWANGLMGCFSHSDSESAYKSGNKMLTDQSGRTSCAEMRVVNIDTAWLGNAEHVANFGDNWIQRASNSFFTGSSNQVDGVRASIIQGNQNIVYNADESNGSDYKMSNMHVFGIANKLRATKNPSYTSGTYSNQFNNNTIFGDKNSIYGCRIANNFVHGEQNVLSDVTILEMSAADFKALQEAYVSDHSNTMSIHYVRITTGGTIYKYNSSMPSSISTETVYAGDLYMITAVYDYTGTNLIGYGLSAAYWSDTQQPSPMLDDLALDIYSSFVFGNRNAVRSRVAGYTVIGVKNEVANINFSSYDCIGNGFIQGNNNTVTDGSNIVCMGNGNVSTGHNSVAIGCQLKSNQWQTVLGKYNAEIAGPNRLASETPQDPTKALLIVGNGYSTKDDSDWQDEQYITRSNALELYANGDLKVTGDVTANNIPAAPTTDGEYLLKCTVSNGTKTYAWIAMNSTTV